MLGPLSFLIFINNLTVSCQPKHAESGMVLYADNAKLFSADSNDLQQSLVSFVEWNPINYHLPQQNVSIYLSFETLMLTRPVINSILENKRFLVCLQCVIWVLLFPVTLDGTNMFVAMSLKLLFVHTKFYSVSVATTVFIRL